MNLTTLFNGCTVIFYCLVVLKVIKDESASDYVNSTKEESATEDLNFTKVEPVDDKKETLLIGPCGLSF